MIKFISFCDYILQCFRQTTPSQNSCVAIRKGPQENGKRAYLALYIYKAAGLTQAYILIAILGLRITTNTVTSASNMSFSEAKNSGLVAIITTSFLYADDQ